MRKSRNLGIEWSFSKNKVTPYGYRFDAFRAETIEKAKGSQTEKCTITLFFGKKDDNKRKIACFLEK